MSNYSVLAAWGSKDALATGTPAKLVSATELGLEFAAIATMSATKEDSINKGAAGGYASLDGTTKVPAAQLPVFTASALGAVNTPGAATGRVLLDNNTWGFPGVLVNNQNGNYTCVLADANTAMVHNNAGAHTHTIPANASVAYPIGTCLTFENLTASGLLSIAITTDTMYLAGAGATTGTRSLAAVGMATAHKVAATVWLISGTNLT